MDDGTIPQRDPVAFGEAVAEALVERGKLDAAAIERARRLAASSGERLEWLFAKLGFVTERDLAQTIAACSGLPLMTPDDFPRELVLEGKVSPRFLREARVLPLAEEDDRLRVAMADPMAGYALDAMRLASGREVVACIGVAADIERAIDQLYGRERAGPGQDVDDSDDAEIALDVERLKDLASEAPVIRLVNQVVMQAVEARASDIHIEPFEDTLRLRYRIDGVLRDMEALPYRLRAAIISRVKIMAKLDIAERRLPQDGRIRLAVHGAPVDLRVSTLPTIYGESVVMRILDRQSVTLDFAALGITGRNLDLFQSILDQPHGIFLVTGPTGSGKTTSLYASLVHLNSPERKILTVEDPIEYELEGINQIQVKPRIGLDFAHVLRSILRQDPDVILVGEIRDLETAQVAAQAALTGHLVLSTLHTNNAAATITRLLDMGLEDYLVTATLTGVAAQRLVRTLCGSCRTPYEAMPELIHELGLQRYAGGDTPQLWRAIGCERCNGTGYRGRTSIAETLVLGEELSRLVLRRAEARELHRAAVAEGMITMYDDGMHKALDGITTVEEVLRVTRDASL